MEYNKEGHEVENEAAKQCETVSTADMLATYSDAEKAKAFRKLDWYMISMCVSCSEMRDRS